MPGTFLAAAAITVAAAVGAGTLTAVVTHEISGDDAVVVRVVDGDTVDVRIGDDTERVRLLNVNAPENNKATGVSECLGVQATAAMRRLLPEGSSVYLRYDAVERDQYGRLLAGVFKDRSLVNAELARAGLGSPLLVGANDRFLHEVQRAWQDAESGQRGVFSRQLPCTLGSIVTQYEREVSKAIVAPVPASSDDLLVAVAAATAVVGAAKVAEEAVDAIAWVPTRYARTVIDRIGDAHSRAFDLESSLQQEYDRAVAQEAAEQAAREEADRKAREEAEAAARAAAEEAQRAAEQRAAQESSGGGSGGGSESGNSGSGGYDGYTGCRAYGSGGTSIDEKGRRYTKIDCTTKLPIGG